MANNKNQVVGQVKVTVNGKKYATSGESSMDIGGTTREAVPGDYDASAFKASTAPAKAEVSLLYKRGVSLAELRDIDDATVVLETDNGTQWIMRHAYVVDVISWSQDGKAKVVFQSDKAEEVL